ncbi:hypothetical protein BSK51_00080 [Paenibacillus odorifer]|uniref:Glucose-1-phosphate thymidylyltransferase n=1 Tax=Paenibacillus odorifer TaxID=189426 RepID=A0ABX3HXU3_9BACL|nr:hypothetical protein BSK51_00080 [Paenibacillus odorifer]
MKGIIPAGGMGSHLYPLTKVTNKYFLPVGKYPMIFHVIYIFKQAGIFYRCWDTIFASQSK